METNYQFYISDWLIKELLRYITELREWASKPDPTWAKREHLKEGENSPAVWL